jgi:hypothetical protein
LDANGGVVRNYTIPSEFNLFALNLDPDGRSFWTASIGGSRAHKVDIDTGAILRTIDATSLGGVSIAGVSVFGEITAAIPRITATPSSLSFLSLNRAVPPVQTVTISRSGGQSLVVEALTTTPPGGTWLQVAVVPPGTPGLFVTMAVVPPGTTPVTIYARATPGSLPLGSYTGSIRVTPSEEESQAINIPVTFELREGALSISGTCPEAFSGERISGAFTVLGATGQLTLTFTGPGFLTLSPTSGTPVNGSFLTTLSGSGAPAGVYPVTITAQQAGFAPATLSCQVRVRDREEPTTPPIVITPSAVCPATSLIVGEPFSSRLVASGGGSFVNFDIVGQLPSGLNLTGSSVSGTPGVAGTFTYTVRATSGTQAAEATCRVTVNPGPLRITTSCPTSAPQGSPYNFAVIPIGGLGGNSYQLTATGLPSGLSVTPGGIRGVPTATPGNYSVEISIRSGDQTVSQTCPFTVAEPVNPPQVSGSCPESVQMGEPFSFPLSVAGTMPHTFSIQGPSWLTISSTATAATVSGNPTEAGAFPIVITVADPNGASTRLRCSITVTALPFTLTGGTCPTGPVNLSQPFSIPASVTGGRGPYNWQISGPSWLTLSSASGASITAAGTPPETGEFPFTVVVTDASGARREFACTVRVVVPPLQITGAESCPTATVSRTAPISVNIAGVGGREPYSWRLEGPAWLALSSNSGRSVSVSGTPGGSGPFTFNATLTDAAGTPAATFACTFTVASITPPDVQVSGLTVTPGATESGQVQLRLSAPAPIPLTARVELIFVPDTVLPGVSDSPGVQFVAAGTVPGRVVTPRSVTMTFGAGEQLVDLGARVALGNVAGVIRIELASLSDAGQDFPQTTRPTAELRVTRAAPVIESVSFTRGGIVVRGFSNTLNIQSVTLAFAPAADVEIEGPTTFTFTSEAQQFFQTLYTNRFRPGSPDAAAGSAFEVRFPITIEGDNDGIASVTVTMENAAGRTTAPAEPLR